MKLRLGTRESLLAQAQSGQIARRIEKANPGVTVELVGIITEGDRITDLPLQKVEGKDFFVKELDVSLLNKRVDLCVHSFKDLSLERPCGIQLAAIPKRLPSHDIVFFKKKFSSRTIKIGTSSPRRLLNIPPFLKKVLPGNLDIEMVPIRGNINTRLARIEEDLDGVVLAASGVERLFLEKPDYIAGVMKSSRWMLCSLSENPTAPAQGALAIECRSEDQTTFDCIRKIHDHESEKIVAMERDLMKEWGGGCHQEFGISAISHKSLESIMFRKGRTETLGDFFDVCQNFPERTVGDDLSYWDGNSFSPIRENLKSTFSNSFSSIFIAKENAFPDEDIHADHLFCAGIKSWQKLAQRGLWVNGCADSLGMDTLSHWLGQLGFLGVDLDWSIFTHDKAVHHKKISTYKITYPKPDAIANAKHIYWSSGHQYDSFKHLCRADVVHACGPGLSSQRLKGVANVFYNATKWREWLGV